MAQYSLVPTKDAHWVFKVVEHSFVAFQSKKYRSKFGCVKAMYRFHDTVLGAHPDLHRECKTKQDI